MELRTLLEDKDDVITEKNDVISGLITEKEDLSTRLATLEAYFRAKGEAVPV